MAPGLLRGQNVPLPHTPVEIRIACAVPAVVAVIIAGPGTRPRLTPSGGPPLPGVTVEQLTPGEHRVVIAPAALEAVARTGTPENGTCTAAPEDVTCTSALEDGTRTAASEIGTYIAASEDGTYTALRENVTCTAVSEDGTRTAAPGIVTYTAGLGNNTGSGTPPAENPSGRASANHSTANHSTANRAPAAPSPEARPAPPQSLTVLLALPGGASAGRFGAVAPAPHAMVTGADGSRVGAFALTGLGPETAVAVLEVYRRNGAWRLRAVGQGYADGLARMLADHGVPDPARQAERLLTAPTARATPPAAPAPRRAPATPRATPAAPAAPKAAPSPPFATHPKTAPPSAAAPHRAPSGAVVPAQRVGAADRPEQGGPVAGDAPGWTLEERLFGQVAAMREDLARRIAAYRSAVDFAQARLDRELDAVLADPATRLGPAADTARERARARRDELADRARAVLDHDLRQLTAESEVVEPALPPAFAAWESPVWHGYRSPPAVPMAVRLGDVHLPEVPELRLPLLARLPLERGVWIDTGTGYAGLTPQDAGTALHRAGATAAALAVRLLASHPAGGLTVHLADPGGTLATAFAPLARTGALRQRADVPAALEEMVRHADLVAMAVRAGLDPAAAGAGEPGERLLVLGGIPDDVDDRAVSLLRYLADEGPAAGVHLMVVADPADARRFGPVLDPMWRSLLRLSPLPDDHLADPWVGHAWTYEPSLPPDTGRVLDRVLDVITGGARLGEGA
ncbi:TerD family protein [Streptomyces sp. SL13]|uniref:TerD family protein n=1 Tax=Streptantibioticus silvisoli TaxID=2705255 RepID=A0AA90H3I6_9ACTN|nr:TerD family protein [Streptantibioticus silvisoli]MDI5970328.1 TerD family protein [Streptantibioticus silvisoli]